jgi:hypothetical protein
MGIATDILNLRRSRFSSVETLISALERFHEAPYEKLPARAFYVDQAADLVLTNVAAHAAEAMGEQPPTTARTQRAKALRRKTLRFSSGPSALQRPLFAERT